MIELTKVQLQSSLNKLLEQESGLTTVLEMTLNSLKLKDKIMKQQNFSNHSRLLFGFHGILFLAILTLLVGSIMNLMNTADENLYSASLLVLVAVILLILMYYVRAFALKAQDKAIRAEEKLRYYILTGKSLSTKITTRQIIGLRFASDEEFLTLAERAEKEELSEKEIKQAIKNWKADSYRV